MAYKRTEHYDEETTSELMDNYRKVLGLIGEDPKREGDGEDRQLDRSP